MCDKVLPQKHLGYKGVKNDHNKTTQRNIINQILNNLLQMILIQTRIRMYKSIRPFKFRGFIDIGPPISLQILDTPPYVRSLVLAGHINIKGNHDHIVVFLSLTENCIIFQTSGR